MGRGSQHTVVDTVCIYRLQYPPLVVLVGSLTISDIQALQDRAHALPHRLICVVSQGHRVRQSMLQCQVGFVHAPYSLWWLCALVHENEALLSGPKCLCEWTLMDAAVAEHLLDVRILINGQCADPHDLMHGQHIRQRGDKVRKAFVPAMGDKDPRLTELFWRALKSSQKAGIHGSRKSHACHLCPWTDIAADQEMHVRGHVPSSRRIWRCHLHPAVVILKRARLLPADVLEVA
mmetsp:Transcript_41363/g.92899  ORF Transcript_41363/g.92899 Transcript_41363/m.92899 type:complete len:234 (+) Transcript_41363:143-844(+)